MAARKNFSTGQIINALRKAEVGIANGKAIKDVCRELGVSEQTYYRWRREYGGMKASQAKRLKGSREGERTAEASGGEPDGGQADPGGSGQGKLLSPSGGDDAWFMYVSGSG